MHNDPDEHSGPGPILEHSLLYCMADNPLFAPSNVILTTTESLEISTESDSQIRKRKRTGSSSSPRSEQIPMEEDEETSGHKQSWQWKDATRDPDYYMEDGSCILLVQDTLFNVSPSGFCTPETVPNWHLQVHRSILSKDNSSFSSMFSLPQGDRIAEGRSDENPIVLLGDSPAEFRHFLWALYAL